MKLSRYSGAGNTFWITDGEVSAKELCQDGTDGVILLRPSLVANYRMEYYNADDSPADLCGNGLRCLARFIEERGDPSPTQTIETPAGILTTRLVGALVETSMPRPERIKEVLGGTLIRVGVPHLVLVVEEVEGVDVAAEGRRLRHHPELGPEGANINWVEITGPKSLKIRTYERGVEGETLACGTGAMAAAYRVGGAVEVTTRSGDRLWVDPIGPSVTGPALSLFSGTLPPLPSTMRQSVTPPGAHGQKEDPPKPPDPPRPPPNGCFRQIGR
ncbi:MAG: diaminopimelate epimerase [Parachlamydiales bacterium]